MRVEKIKKKEDILEIQEEVKIVQEDHEIILEKGDKIKILKEYSPTVFVRKYKKDILGAYKQNALKFSNFDDFKDAMLGSTKTWHSPSAGLDYMTLISNVVNKIDPSIDMDSDEGEDIFNAIEEFLGKGISTIEKDVFGRTVS